MIVRVVQRPERPDSDLTWATIWQKLRWPDAANASGENRQKLFLLATPASVDKHTQRQGHVQSPTVVEQTRQRNRGWRIDDRGKCQEQAERPHKVGEMERELRALQSSRQSAGNNCGGTVSMLLLGMDRTRSKSNWILALGLYCTCI